MHHVFQPFPVDELEFNPFEKFSKDWAAVVVNDSKNQRANAMTVAWGMVGILWDKKVCALFIHESRYTKELLDNESTCSVNFLDMDAKGNRNALKFLGSASGRNEDKLKEIGFEIDKDGDTPYLDAGNFVILCRKLASYPVDPKGIFDDVISKQAKEKDEMHIMYVFEITKVMAR
jgi:flavin reductase (DIM6/NTAB) family NADH-FMN oxidoreductase RutF